MKHITLFLATFVAALACSQGAYAAANKDAAKYDSQPSKNAPAAAHHEEVINDGIKGNEHKPAGVAQTEVNPNGCYKCGSCPTICYVPEVEYCPKYRCEKKCYTVPETYYVKKCRYRPEYYEKTYCRMVPQYYTKTFCRQVPEYYNEACTREKKCYYTEKHCEYRPVCKYKKVCSYNNAPQGCATCK